MFGYIRVRRDLLSSADLAAYEAAYCGVCRAMGRRYGSFSRLFLNYDFAFLAMLLAPPESSCAGSCHRCPVHPIHGKVSCEGGPWMDAAAGESVILTYWKLRDSAADDGFWTGMGARALSLLLTPAYRRARRAQPHFDRQVSALLDELGALEREGCPSIDKTADCFARLLRAAAPATGDPTADRAMGQLLYHIGRWIYLIDGVDDLADDRASGNYNPVAARFPQWDEPDRAYLRQMLDHSLNLAGAAYHLLQPNAWAPVIENILYSGLPGVEELVFSGQWREYLRKQRRGSQ